MSQAELTHSIDSRGTVLSARGAWTAQGSETVERLWKSVSPALGLGGSVRIDASGIAELDTYGACLIGAIGEHLRRAGNAVSVEGLDDRFIPLVQAVEHSGGRNSLPLDETTRLSDWIVSVGRAVSEAVLDLRTFAVLLGQVAYALVRAVRNPATFRLTSTIHQLDRVAWQAVPIIILMTFLIGCIIAQQGFFHFRKFGADQYVVDMVGILILREIGVLLVAIMVAGRSGSSYTAELGSMKMREEIDAVRTMGLDPISVLVLPRILALVLALPALTLIGSISALYGGGLVAWLYGDMNPDIYIARLQEALSMDHFKVGMLKAPFMALVIGIVAATEGLAVSGSAESLGLKTTASVVKSIFLVIVLDGLFAVYFAAIGM